MYKNDKDYSFRDEGQTISELYRWAVKNGVECLPLVMWDEWKAEDDYTQIRSAEVSEDRNIGAVVYLY